MFRTLIISLILFFTSFACTATESSIFSTIQEGPATLLKITNANQALNIKIWINEKLEIEKNINDNNDIEYFEVLQLTHLNNDKNDIKIIVEYNKTEPKINLFELSGSQLTAHKNAISVLTSQRALPTKSPLSILTNLPESELQEDFSRWVLRQFGSLASAQKNWPLRFYTQLNLNEFSANDIIAQCNAWMPLFEKESAPDSAIKIQISAQLAATLYVYSKHHGELDNKPNNHFTSSRFLKKCDYFFDGLATSEKTNLDLDEYAKYLYQRVLKALSESPKLLTADILHHIWFYYNFRDKHSLALETATHAIAKAENNPQYQFLMSELYSNAFLSSYREGAFAKAHDFLNKGLNLGNQSSNEKVTSLLFSKGFLYYKTGEFDTGSRYFEKVISATSSTGETNLWTLQNCLGSSPTKNLMIARTAVMIGATSREEGALSEANRWLECATHLLDGQHDYYQIVLQVELAKTAIKQKQFAKAKVHLDNIFSDPRTLYSTQIDAKILQSKIDTVHLGKDSDREELDELAILLGYKSFYDEDIIDIVNTALPIKQIEVFTLLVQISQQEKSFKWVDIFAEKAMSLIETSRFSVANPQAWNAARFSFINTFITSLLDDDRIQQSTDDYVKLFQVLEKFYSVDPRQEKNLFSIDEVPSENEEHINRLYDIWLAEEKQMLLSESANENLRVYEARDDYLTGLLKEPNLDADIKTISLKTFQQALPSGQMLVRYFSDGQTMYALNITHSYQEVREIAQVSTLKNMVDNYVAGASSSAKPWFNQEFQKIPLLPVDIIEDQSIEKILIIPDESLHIMPFSMWNTSVENKRYVPLVETAQSVFITSATSYFENIAVSNSANFEISIFANPDFTIQAGDTIPNPLSSDSSTLFNVSSLPGTLNEGEFMANLFAGQKINRGIAENATSQFLMSKEVRSSKILHIGTHGYFDKKLPDIVGVLTTGENSQGKISPGFLSLSQLLSKPVSSDLVFISGCETMVGKNYKGSGMRSITRGFLAQGAKTVVGTIWPIQDRATSAFVKLFYSNLLEFDGDAPKALQMAQNTFHQAGRYRHPKYWAGFVLTSSNQGDSQLFSHELAKNVSENQ